MDLINNKIYCFLANKSWNKKGKSNKELSGGLFVVFGDKSKRNYVSFYDNEGTLRGEMPISNYRANNIIFRNV